MGQPPPGGESVRRPTHPVSFLNVEGRGIPIFPAATEFKHDSAVLDGAENRNETVNRSETEFE